MAGCHPREKRVRHQGLINNAKPRRHGEESEDKNGRRPASRHDTDQRGIIRRPGLCRVVTREGARRSTRNPLARREEGAAEWNGHSPPSRASAPARFAFGHVVGTVRVGSRRQATEAQEQQDEHGSGRGRPRSGGWPPQACRRVPSRRHGAAAQRRTLARTTPRRAAGVRGERMSAVPVVDPSGSGPSPRSRARLPRSFSLPLPSSPRPRPACRPSLVLPPLFPFLFVADRARAGADGNDETANSKRFIDSPSLPPPPGLRPMGSEPRRRSLLMGGPTRTPQDTGPALFPPMRAPTADNKKPARYTLNLSSYRYLRHHPGLSVPDTPHRTIRGPQLWKHTSETIAASSPPPACRLGMRDKRPFESGGDGEGRITPQTPADVATGVTGRGPATSEPTRCLIHLFIAHRVSGHPPPYTRCARKSGPAKKHTSEETARVPVCVTGIGQHLPAALSTGGQKR